MMDVVNQTNMQAEVTEERTMPEPGSLFAKKEETPIVPVQEDNSVAVPQNIDIPKVENISEQTATNKIPNFCSNCGTPTNGIGNYCTNCGHKLI